MNDDHNEDWMKGTWDLWVGGTLVTTIEQLCEVLGAEPASASDAIKDLLTRPSARAMPAELRVSIHRRYPELG